MCYSRRSTRGKVTSTRMTRAIDNKPKPGPPPVGGRKLVRDLRADPGPAPMHRRGRPTKLTPAITEAVANLIRSGNFISTAADFIGVDRSSIFGWLKRGKNDDRGLYRDFFDAVRHAEARWTASLVASATLAAHKDDGGRMSTSTSARSTSAGVMLRFPGASGSRSQNPTSRDGSTYRNSRSKRFGVTARSRRLTSFAPRLASTGTKAMSFPRSKADTIPRTASTKSSHAALSGPSSS
jgi:hypothetical protein